MQLVLAELREVTTLTTLVGCALLAVGVWGSLTTLWRERA